jgi:SPP1 gp7 family putative phage head morphogenesis protein
MSSLGIRLGLDRERQEQLLPILRERLADWLRLSFRHDILVARAVRGLQIEAARSFDRLVLNPLLQLVVDRVPQAQLRTGDLSRDLFPELVSLRAAVEDVVRQGVSAVQRLTETRVAEIARGEVRWAEASFRKVVGEEFGAGVAEAFGAGVEQKAATSLRDRVWLGDSTEKWFEKALETPTADAARAYITTGVKQGLTLDEMTKGIAGTRTQKGILARPKATAQALVRTAATHATSIAQVESFRALGITHWRFVATLDLRTSIQCASNDGQVYPLDEGPLPPLHPNCRSKPSPVINPNREPRGQRAALGGQVPASTTFEDWLGTQTQAEQNIVLGRAKAEAWRSGKLTLADMLGRDLQPLSLAELKELDRL